MVGSSVTDSILKIHSKEAILHKAEHQRVFLNQRELSLLWILKSRNSTLLF